MDIIAFLTEDHRRIVELLSEVRDEDTPRGRKKKLSDLLAHLRTHEEIESSLFNAQAKIQADETLQFLIDNFGKLHEVLWHLTRLYIDAVDSGEPDTIDRTFKDLDWIIRQHMQSEEEILFPKIRARLSQEELSQLGEYQASNP